MNVYDCAHALARAIKQSPEHQNFQKALEQLNREPSARDMLNDLRQLQLRIQHLTMQGQEVDPEEEEKLTKLTEIVNLNLTARTYLEAEYRFALVMSDVQKIIGESIEGLITNQQETGDNHHDNADG